jgi:hypothetical protein
MIVCTTITESDAKDMRNYFKAVLANQKHSPTYLVNYAREYVMKYDFLHSDVPPSFVDEISGD